MFKSEITMQKTLWYKELVIIFIIIKCNFKMLPKGLGIFSYIYSYV